MALLEGGQSWNLFGYDIRQGFYFFIGGWRDFLWGTRSPVRDRLDEAVTVETSAGERYCYQAGRRVNEQDTLATALLLPSDLVLHKQLNMPAAAEGNIDTVVAMEVMANSPFPPDDTAHGWSVSSRADDRLVVELVICARSAIMEYVFSHYNTHDMQAYEVWADVGDEQYVELSGFGEGRRAGRYRKRLVRTGLVLAYCASVCILSFALATGSQYLEMGQVRGMLAEARDETRSAVNLRSELLAGNELVKTANSIMSSSPDLYQELTELSKLLDDATWVTQVNVQGQVIRIDGQSPDAATVMQRLTDEERYSNVNALVPIRKVPRSEMERFVFELRLVPEEAP